MPQPRPSPPRSVIGSLVVIAAVVGGTAAAFGYTAGWFSPDRITPNRMVDAFGPDTDARLGHRRNHAKGLCFTGSFEASGAGAALSRAQMMAQGSYPVVGRLNLGVTDPVATDASARVRGMSLQVRTPDGGEWRSAMIDLPFFPVSTPQAFYGLMQASASKDPGAMPAFAAAHPELGNFGAWAKTAPWTGSFAEERYNSINSFVFTDASGRNSTVRWSMQPEATPMPIPHEELERRDASFLEGEIRQRLASGPVRWRMTVTVANPGDPTADPSKAWPEDRRTVEAGTLVLSAVQAEADGPCREINYDPTVLPDGMRTSDDPFPAARSAAYAKSFDRRTAESGHYPRTAAVGARP
ncbi:catalase family peroxidase [Roseomonas elaeocarpi]|uniref:Catalase-related peroxidase n=1 Tax=Roseomonas elaeocarpi TaxID=907779 RepID=A0ABV6JWU6_9PROT